MINRYPGPCAYCGGNVPPNGGALVKRHGKLMPAHLACCDAKRPAVNTYRFSTGATMTQNARGRCIDTPCCGCCS